MSDLILPTNVGNYVFIEQIPSTGTTWRAVNNTNQESVSIRIISKSSVSSQKSQALFASEISFMRRLEHPLIGKLYEVIEDNSYYYIVTDLPKSPSLREKITEKGKFTEEVAKNFLAQLLSFFSYFDSPSLKNSRISITPDTVFVDDKLNIKQVFVYSENSQIINSTPETVMNCMPPETVNNQSQNPSFTWLCGIFLYYVLVGKFPFDEANVQNIEKSLLNNHPEIPDNLSDDCTSLIKKLLIKNPVTRIPFTSIINLKWMKGAEIVANQVPKPIQKPSPRKSFQAHIKSESPAKFENRMPVERQGSTSHMSIGRVRLTPRKSFVPLGRQSSLKQFSVSSQLS